MSRSNADKAHGGHGADNCTATVLGSGGRESQRLECSPRQQLQRTHIASLFGEGPAVHQLAAISKDALNVAGEDHKKSKRRLGMEQAMAQQLAGGQYWLEGDFKTAPGSSDPADPWQLRLLFCFQESSAQAGRLAMLNVEGFVKMAQQGERKALRKHMKVIRGALRSHTFSDLRGYAKQVFADQYDEAVKPLLEEPRRLRKRIRVLTASDPAATGFDAAMKEMGTRIGELQGCFAKLQHVLEPSSPGFMNRDLSKERSRLMHAAAERGSAQRGIWKVGDHHASHMRDFAPRRYNLVSKDEFDTEAGEFAKTWAPPTLRIKLKLKEPEAPAEAEAKPDTEGVKRQRIGEKSAIQADTTQDSPAPSGVAPPEKDTNEN